MPQVKIANHEIVTAALYLAGGENQRVDTEDIAVKANEIAPGRFNWRKYPDQINIDTVRKRLWDAMSPAKGNLMEGSEKTGWILTRDGVETAKRIAASLGTPVHQERPRTLQERQWAKKERIRLLSTKAFQQLQEHGLSAVTQRDAEAFFRISEYSDKSTKAQKINRLVSQFSNDDLLGEAVQQLAAIAGGR